MYFRVNAPWEHYPKNLRFSEVQSPLIVVNQFFDLDWPEGHLEYLKIWRHHVINYESYQHEKFGPGKLFDAYEATLKLLEALFIISLDSRLADRSVINSDKDLQEEHQSWYWFPNNLSSKELINPFVAIKRVFKRIKPQQFREYLNEWIHFGLSTHAVEESMSTSEILLVYKSIKKLYSAAWVIRQRESDHPILRKGAFNEAEDVPQCEKSIPKVDARGIIRISQTMAEKLALKQVVDTIIKVHPFVKAIIHINSSQSPDNFMLYLLFDDNELPINEVLNRAIEKTVASLIQIHTVIESESILSSHNEGTRAFLRYAMAKGIVVYKAQDMDLALPSSAKAISLLTTLKTYHEKKLSEASAYYDQIQEAIDSEKYFQGVQLVKRSLDATLLAVLCYKLGYQDKTSKIDRLYLLTELFTNDLSKRFNDLKEKEPDLYRLLISAEVDCPYAPPVASYSDVVRLKVELTYQRGIVKELM